MQTATVEQLFPTDAQSILERLPTRIRTALIDDLWSVVDLASRSRLKGDRLIQVEPDIIPNDILPIGLIGTVVETNFSLWSALLGQLGHDSAHDPWVMLCGNSRHAKR
jgi:hypothetical protein